MKLEKITPCHWLDHNRDTQGPVEWQNIRFAIRSSTTPLEQAQPNAITENTPILPQGATKWLPAKHYLNVAKNNHQDPQPKTRPGFIYAFLILFGVIGVGAIFAITSSSKDKQKKAATSQPRQTAEQKCKNTVRSWLRLNIKDRDHKLDNFIFYGLQKNASGESTYFCHAIITAKNSFGVKLTKVFHFYLSRDYTILQAKEH